MTVATFTTALAGLTITGVTRKLASPPAALSTADLPSQWVQLPTITDEVARTMAQHGKLWAFNSAQFVVAYEAVGQSTQAANWSATLTMMDAVHTALAGSGAALGRGRLTYIIRQAIVNVAGNDYWAVVAEVTVHG